MKKLIVLLALIFIFLYKEDLYFDVGGTIGSFVGQFLGQESDW